MDITCMFALIFMILFILLLRLVFTQPTSSPRCVECSPTKTAKSFSIQLFHAPRLMLTWSALPLLPRIHLTPRDVTPQQLQADTLDSSRIKSLGQMRYLFYKICFFFCLFPSFSIIFKDYGSFLVAAAAYARHSIFNELLALARSKRCVYYVPWNQCLRAAVVSGDEAMIKVCMNNGAVEFREVLEIASALHLHAVIALLEPLSKR